MALAASPSAASALLPQPRASSSRLRLRQAGWLPSPAGRAGRATGARRVMLDGEAEVKAEADEHLVSEYVKERTAERTAAATSTGSSDEALASRIAAGEFSNSSPVVEVLKPLRKWLAQLGPPGAPPGPFCWHASIRWRAAARPPAAAARRPVAQKSTSLRSAQRRGARPPRRSALTRARRPPLVRPRFCAFARPPLPFHPARDARGYGRHPRDNRAGAQAAARPATRPAHAARASPSSCPCTTFSWSTAPSSASLLAPSRSWWCPTRRWPSPSC